ncbi:MAG: NAD(P)H-hydrate dehydratase [Proteobacteria bacterium]|jgi:ADP-dependent NAD(P)H-hydrate dehydratase / NAD(P)H-hydrate epimerase|nr:NAD(P)H-hydrate dehydratase [Pseudomonadota bacterium]
MRKYDCELFDSAASKALDALCIETQGVSGYELMAQAGHQAYLLLVARYWRAKSVVVFCGPGNNGGDGYVLARLLHQAGFGAQVYSLKEPATKDARRAAQEANSAGVKIDTWRADMDWQADLLVDAMLGIGLKTSLRADYLSCVREINQRNLPVLAIDVPTGVDADTGGLLPEAIVADSTITFITRKAGLYSGPALNVRGELYFSDLAVAPELYDRFDPTARLIQAALPDRKPDSHKGSYGQVAALGGERTMRGAIFLSSHAALRSGAGLVTAHTPDAGVTEIDEVMSQQWRIGDALPKCDVLLFGPGAGQGEWAQAAFEAAQDFDKLKVFDADALALLADRPNRDDQRIITPHPGEAARLLGVSKTQIQTDRFQAVRDLQAKYGGVAVLKGAGTLVCDGDQLQLCDRGNAGMATAGSGDVLAGIIAALLAQGLVPMAAACQGVLLHAIAGDLATAEQSEQGVIASSITAHIPQAIKIGSDST